MIRNLALDQTKIKQICDKANFTNGVSSYILNLTQPLSNTTNSISNSFLIIYQIKKLINEKYNKFF